MAAKKKNNSYKTELRLKTSLFYAIQILVDIIILLILVKGFSMAYGFSYSVFNDSAKNQASTEYKVITILDGDSTSKISEKLEKEGIIDNKYVMMAKIKVGSYGSKIKSGQYGLSPSMTYNEIIKIITNEQDDDGKNKDKDKVNTTGKEVTATSTDAAEKETESVSEGESNPDGSGEDDNE